MTPELEQKLIEKYPTMFRDRNKSPRETLMCFGCEHGDGWYGILDNLCGYIHRLQTSISMFLSLKKGEEPEYTKIHCPDVIFMQIKEKFGTLRVYWNFGEIKDYEQLVSKSKDPKEYDEIINSYRNMIENAIDFCEYLSSKTCETCGNPGTKRGGGWIVVKCDECYEKIS